MPAAGDHPHSPAASIGACDLSVVMPLFNCLALTQACVASLVATLPPTLAWELLLVDDGSTDGTRPWLSEVSDHRIRVLLNEKNRGYAATNNRGVAASRGRRIALLNNDLVLTEGWLQPMWSLLDTRPGSIVGNVQFAVATGLVDHAGIEISAKGKPEHVRCLAPYSGACLPALAVTGACVLLERRTWEEVGGFDEAFTNGGEDVDFCFRAAEKGHFCWVAADSRIFHHVSSSPNRKLRDEYNSARLARKWQRELVRHGVAAWVRDYLTRDLTVARSLEQPSEHLHLFAYWLGFARFPPPTAVRGLSNNLAKEIERWRALGVY